MKKLLSILLLSFLMLQANWAQISGYQGKHVVVKTDLSAVMPDRGFSAGIEAAIFRNLSIEAEFRMTNKKIKQLSIVENDLDDLSFDFGFDEDEFLANVREKATTSELVVNLGLKVYLNAAYPAPRGPYFYVRYGMGSLDVDRDLVKDEYSDLLGDYVKNLYTYKIENVPTKHIQYGGGVSYIFAKVLFINASWGMHHYIVGGVKDDYLEIADITNKIGPNIYNFATLKQNEDADGLGMSFRLAIGILVF